MPAITTSKPRNTRQRREQILRTLVDHGQVNVTELVHKLGVSAVTIRHDLEHFQEQGIVSRSYGGAALSRAPLPEQDVREKAPLNSSSKQAIGARAAQLVRPGDNIIIDSGTTTLDLARHLRGMSGVTVMTNGLNIADELADAEGISLLLTGGLLRRQSLSFHGAQAEACLNAYSFDTLFLGVDGLDLQFGVSTHDEAEARLNHRMVERARKVVVLADASKFGRIALHRIALLSEIDVVVTDAGLADEYRDSLQRLGVELIIANGKHE